MSSIKIGNIIHMLIPRTQQRGSVYPTKEGSNQLKGNPESVAITYKTKKKENAIVMDSAYKVCVCDGL